MVYNSLYCDARMLANGTGTGKLVRWQQLPWQTRGGRTLRLESQLAVYAKNNIILNTSVTVYIPVPGSDSTSASASASASAAASAAAAAAAASATSMPVPVPVPATAADSSSSSPSGSSVSHLQPVAPPVPTSQTAAMGVFHVGAPIPVSVSPPPRVEAVITEAELKEFANPAAPSPAAAPVPAPAAALVPAPAAASPPVPAPTIAVPVPAAAAVPLATGLVTAAPDAAEGLPPTLACGSLNSHVPDATTDGIETDVPLSEVRRPDFLLLLLLLLHVCVAHSCDSSLEDSGPRRQSCTICGASSRTRSSGDCGLGRRLSVHLKSFFVCLF